MSPLPDCFTGLPLEELAPNVQQNSIGWSLMHLDDNGHLFLHASMPEAAVMMALKFIYNPPPELKQMVDAAHSMFLRDNSTGD